MILHCSPSTLKYALQNRVLISLLYLEAFFKFLVLRQSFLLLFSVVCI
jgi:hypothetical protein